ncbi:GNAT family N-acetyltransferase [Longispora sp. NPDC051575]|uniref:GNAT family N-acetyltransferase n=1 Tax=Longispora sp. NPDC051575 TaxID=3154943 RepID=UPI003416AD12
MRITLFEPDAVTEGDWDDLAEVARAAAAADRPTEPAPTRATTVTRLTAPPSPKRRLPRWTLRDGGRIVGHAMLVLFDDENTDLAGLDVTVHPDHRRRGVGTALLRTLVGAAEGRSTLFLEGLPEGGPGAAWAGAHGFEVVQRTALQALDLSTVDRSRWRTPAAPGYRLARWRDSVPEEYLASYAAARNALHDAPRGDLDFTMPEWDPLRVREAEAATLGRGGETRIVAAVHEATGTVAGLTLLEVYAHSPAVGRQQDTCVLAAHRGHRLGLWMKADNLLWLAEDRPEVTRVGTYSAADNGPMLRVNRQVGFVVEASTANLRADRAALAARLGG